MSKTKSGSAGKRMSVVDVCFKGNERLARLRDGVARRMEKAQGAGDASKQYAKKQRLPNGRDQDYGFRTFPR